VKILSTELYESQLKDILEKYFQDDFNGAKKFKIYLDTLIINIPTKIKKYKQSLLFEDENIKEVDYENFKVLFYHDTENSHFVILSIVSKYT